MASVLSSLEIEYGDPLDALDYITLAIRNYQDSGSVAFLHSPLVNLAAILDRVGHFASAAVVVSFGALNPMAVVSGPQIAAVINHIRENLGTPTYDALVREGATMTPAAIVAYAYEQIDQARAELSRR